ncbi:MAG: DUF559 domain-containing protein [Bacteroidales bacterium]|nr:DUF559 domain-containing protein [Bacteroidales bacterium]
MNTNNKWGFLRETREKAAKAGIDKATGLHRTGLEDYLKVIFPGVKENEWIHDKADSKTFGKNIRPDYRCDKLMLIIEFDGVQHYKQPDTIIKDKENQKLYEDHGYKVVRIPYFIQLTNEVVKTMFGVDVKDPLFDPTIPSMASSGRNTPAYCCSAGLKRMMEDFKKYPQQYKVNMDALKKENNEFLTGWKMLKKEFEK